MSSGFRLHLSSRCFAATGQISARQVDAARRVRLTDFLRRLLREAKGLLRRQIDALGDDLYALTPAEIKIVEGAAK
jgi:hypothetical protein